MRWPFVLRSTYERDLGASTRAARADGKLEGLNEGRDRALVIDNDLQQLKKEHRALQASMPPPDILAMAKAIGGNMSVKQIANLQLMTKNNFRDVKLMAAALIQAVHRHLDDMPPEVVNLAENLELAGCVAPDDMQALTRVGDRFAIPAGVELAPEDVPLRPGKVELVKGGDT